jgi:hypothetical protein
MLAVGVGGGCQVFSCSRLAQMCRNEGNRRWVSEVFSGSRLGQMC